MANMVEIACFAHRNEAELTAYFLQRHGLNAFAGAGYHGEVSSASTHGNHMGSPVWVSDGDFREAQALLRKVAEGGFADADPNRDSREGLGAALALALAPEPGYRKPAAWMLWAPLFCIPALLVIGFLGRLLWLALTGN